VVTPFVIANPHLRMPDNLAFQPNTGILYVLMDATTTLKIRILPMTMYGHVSLTVTTAIPYPMAVCAS
jgi:hypothetical protein